MKKISIVLLAFACFGCHLNLATPRNSSDPTQPGGPPVAGSAEGSAHRVDAPDATQLQLGPLAATTEAVAARTDVEYKILPVTLEGQETSLWCWATSAEMIMRMMGKEVSQCSQATARYGEKKDVSCCGLGAKLSSDAKSTCVRGGWPQFSHWGFESKNTKHECENTDHCALSWDALRAEIDADRPVAFSWRYEGGGGHMMVASGYVFIPPDGRYVVVDNPWPPHSGDAELITYDRYVNGSYQHWRDYYDIRPAAEGESK